MFAKGRITTTGDVFRDEKSLAFDGSNDYVDCGSSFDLDDDDFTILGWIKASDLTSNPVISQYADSANRWFLWFDASNRLQFFSKIANSTIISVIGTAQTSLENTWIHFAFTADRSGGNQAMYINGVLNQTDTDTSTTSFSPAVTNLHIGRYHTTYSNSNISEVAIYNSALTANQVKTIYNGREPYNHKEGVASGNLQAWYRMGDATDFAKDYGFIIPDQMSRGINTIKSWDFSSDVDGWTGYSGNTLEHSTAITNHLGGSGVVKCINADNGDKFIGGRSSALTDSDPGIEANKHYLIEYYLYVPTSWSGTTNIRLQEASMSGKTYANDVVLIDYSVKDSWQYGSNIFSPTSGDLGGFIYLQAIATTNFEADDFVYLSGVTLKEIDSKNGKMTNMDITDIEGDTP